MEVQFTLDQQARVEEGFAAGDKGEFVEHAEILRTIERRYPA